VPPAVFDQCELANAGGTLVENDPCAQKPVVFDEEFLFLRSCPRVGSLACREAGFRSDRLSREAVKLFFQAPAFRAKVNRRTVEDDLALVDEEHPVGHGLDLLENMRRY
jgi:hypothetical protein